MEHYGFNLKSQLVKIVVFAIVSAVVAFVLVQVR